MVATAVTAPPVAVTVAPADMEATLAVGTETVAMEAMAGTPLAPEVRLDTAATRGMVAQAAVMVLPAATGAVAPDPMRE